MSWRGGENAGLRSPARGLACGLRCLWRHRSCGFLIGVRRLDHRGRGAAPCTRMGRWQNVGAVCRRSDRQWTATKARPGFCAVAPATATTRGKLHNKLVAQAEAIRGAQGARRSRTRSANGCGPRAGRDAQIQIRFWRTTTGWLSVTPAPSLVNINVGAKIPPTKSILRAETLGEQAAGRIRFDINLEGRDHGRLAIDDNRQEEGGQELRHGSHAINSDGMADINVVARTMVAQPNSSRVVW